MLTAGSSDPPASCQPPCIHPALAGRRPLGSRLNSNLFSYMFQMPKASSKIASKAKKTAKAVVAAASAAKKRITSAPSTSTDQDPPAWASSLLSRMEALERAQAGRADGGAISSDGVSSGDEGSEQPRASKRRMSTHKADSKRQKRAVVQEDSDEEVEQEESGVEELRAKAKADAQTPSTSSGKHSQLRRTRNSVPAQVQTMIREKQYVPLRWLRPNTDAAQTEDLPEKWAKQEVDRESEIKTMEEWHYLFNVFAIVYAEEFPKEAPQLFQYHNNVAGVASKHGFRTAINYDVRFRKERRGDEMTEDDPWDLMRHDILLDLASPTGKPFPGSKAGDSKIVCCYDYNGKGCNRKTCSFAHACSYCKKMGHPKSKCFSRPQAGKGQGGKPSNAR